MKSLAAKHRQDTTGQATSMADLDTANGEDAVRALEYGLPIIPRKNNPFKTRRNEMKTDSNESKGLDDALRGADGKAGLLTIKVSGALRPWLSSKRRKREDDGTKGNLGSAASRILCAVRDAEQGNEAD